MKTKIIAAIVAAAMSITLAACGANTPVNNSADNAASNTALKATQPETDTQVVIENETEIVTETVTEKVTNAQGKTEIVTKTVEKAVPKMTVNANGKSVPVTKSVVKTVSVTKKAATTKTNNGKPAKTTNATAKATIAKATTKKPAQTVVKTTAKPATTKHTHTWKKVQTNEGDMVKVEYDTIVSYETSGDGFRMYGKTISMNPMTIQCIWVKLDFVLQDGWEGTVWVRQPDGKFYCAEKNKTINDDNGKTQYKAEPAEPVYEWHCTTCGKVSKTEP